MSDHSRPSLPPFPSGYRASGMPVHVTSLPTPYGIGDVGPVAIACINPLCDAGQSWWQSLPLGPTGYANSPYQWLSSFAGNELLISPDWLIEEGLLQPNDCEALSVSRSAVVYNNVIPFKYRLLEKAWTNFIKAGSVELRVAFDQFCQGCLRLRLPLLPCKIFKSRGRGSHERPRSCGRQLELALYRRVTIDC
jgi:4-alpha-glucanotransferase